MTARLFFVGAAALLAALGGALPAAAAGAKTLRAVKDRGSLVCGVSPGIPGFSSVDAKGEWSGFDVDFCRAVAAAIFDDPKKVTFVPLTANERFEALRAKKVDLLSRNSTWTLTSENENNVLFAGVTYYDGQGFLAPKSKNVTSALELGGSKVCVKSGTSAPMILTAYFDANNMKLETVAFDTMADMLKAYDAGKCDVVTSDVSQLHAGRLNLAKPGDHVILADVISKEPLGPAVRQDDLQWFNLVKWVNFAMLDAEELGIAQTTLEDAKQSKKPAVQRFIGAEGDFGKPLGLTPDWTLRVVKAVGNYGESFERNIGAQSPLGIARGLNHLWSMGGIHYAPPVR